MEKEKLRQYIDACELIKETEHDIQRLKKKKQTVLMDSVKGSMPEFPYIEQHFHIEGTSCTYVEDSRLRIEEKLLEERRLKAEQLRAEVEAWMSTIPLRMQRIVRYKFFEGLSWERIAIKLGCHATADSVRMELERFLQKKIKEKK